MIVSMEAKNAQLVIHLLLGARQRSLRNTEKSGLGERDLSLFPVNKQHFINQALKGRASSDNVVRLHGSKIKPLKSQNYIIWINSKVHGINNTCSNNSPINGSLSS